METNTDNRILMFHMMKAHILGNTSICNRLARMEFRTYEEYQDSCNQIDIEAESRQAYNDFLTYNSLEQE